VRDVELIDHLIVEHLHAPGCDRPHGQLGVTRHSELADDEDVEGSAERAGDFHRNRHAPTRQSQHHDIVAIRVWDQEGRELPAAVGPVMESHGSFIYRSFFAAPSAAFSCARAPARIPSMPSFPSWQAYS
jgi:hypothetical protein